MPGHPKPRVPHADDVEAFLDSPEFEAALCADDDSEARSLLAAGCPIYVVDPGDPDRIVRQFPDGRRQIVDVGPNGKISVLHDL
jgi:hypothetical protein